MKLKGDFFERDVVIVARELLGGYFVHKTKQGRLVGKIVETEAYGDADDLASHARFGPTPRNQIMFGPPGALYVYMIYGIFNLTNIVCGKEGSASAILIRAAEIIEGREIIKANIEQSKFAKSDGKLATGPGKFSLAFNIDRTLNGLDITKSQQIYIEQIGENQEPDVVTTTRIGVDYAKHSKELPWRFYLRNNPFVSRR